MPQNAEELLTDPPGSRGTGEQRAPLNTLSPERVDRARAVYRSYYRMLRASRFILAAFIACGAVFLLWIIPWIPTGLDTADYPPSVAFTIYLLVATSFMGMAALVLREVAWRKRESLLVWGTVYDETTGLHNRTYLLDRLSLECDRAERSGGVFSLIVLQIRHGVAGGGKAPVLTSSVLDAAAERIDAMTHPTDLVSLLSSNELAVLVIDVDRANRNTVLERLRKAVTEELRQQMGKESLVTVIGGASTYPTDAKDPDGLVQAARTAAALSSNRRPRVA